MSNTWKMEVNLNSIEGLSTYRAVNILLLGNKTFSPVKVNNGCFFRDSKKGRYTLSGEFRIFKV